MKSMTKRSIVLILVLIVCISSLPLFHANASSGSVDYVYDGSYLYNWGTRGEDATFLSPNASEFYKDGNTYAIFSALDGGATTDTAPTSALYAALQKLMKEKHTHITTYGETRPLYQYTDCQNNGGKISSFYSGKEIGPAWDGGSTWNREHTWPDSKGLAGSDENDIMMLRPTATSENGARGNKAYGESSGYYHPNSESNGAFDVRGDCARIFLYIYVRWGNVNGNGKYSTWGTSGVMESLDVLLTWMEEDPVDTWELGRNDSVQSITGTRNVFVDYPELAFLLFDREVPNDMTTPSGEAKNQTATPDTSIEAETTTEAPTPIDPTPEEPKVHTLSSDTITLYTQTRSDAATNDLRVIFVTKGTYLSLHSKLNVTITFNSTETPKTYHGVLGSGSEDFVLYRTIIAEGDTYKAEDGCYLFGVAIVDIPKTTVTSATIVLKDASGILISQGTVELP